VTLLAHLPSDRQMLVTEAGPLAAAVCACLGCTAKSRPRRISPRDIAGSRFYDPDALERGAPLHVFQSGIQRTEGEGSSGGIRQE